MSNLTPAQIFAPAAALLLGLVYVALLVLDLHSGKTVKVVKTVKDEELETTTTSTPEIDLSWARAVVGILAIIAVSAAFGAYTIAL